jgi:tetratricopeptide (TPR) repeat protein
MSDDPKQQALAEKDLGNAAYKKRQFEEALQHYDKAWELDNTNMTVLTNKAGKHEKFPTSLPHLWREIGLTDTFLVSTLAVQFEQEKYEECIKTCEQAVDVGRENRADYKLIAR